MTLTDAEVITLSPDEAVQAIYDLNAIIEQQEAEIRRLRAAQITTLVPCSRCGLGQRPRNMVALDNDEWLCVECAKFEIYRLREALQQSRAWIIDNSDGDSFWVNAPSELERLNAALHNAAADRDHAGESG